MKPSLITPRLASIRIIYRFCLQFFPQDLPPIQLEPKQVLSPSHGQKINVRLVETFYQFTLIVLLLPVVLLHWIFLPPFTPASAKNPLIR